MTHYLWLIESKRNPISVGKKKSQKDKTKKEQKNQEELERMKSESLKKQKAEQGWNQ